MPNVTAKERMTIDWITSAPTIAVPVYQREYRWSLEICHKLLLDIRAIADSDEGHTHFIGSILVSKDDNGGLTLVDGQQRITTLMLLMAAIRDLAAETEPQLAAEVTTILCTPGAPSRPRLHPHERYVDVVSALLTRSPVSPGETSFEENYEFFLGDMAEDWRQVWSGLQRLEHVTIELVPPRANAQQIFESLNSTGARLSDDELIHNYIHIGRSREAQEALERTVWLPIEEGTLGATREFWRDYLVATSATQPDFKGDFGLYKAFSRRYPEVLKSLTTEVGAEWVRYASRYGALLDPDREADPEVREQLRLVRMFEGGPRPLMLKVYDDLQTGVIDKSMFVETSTRLQSMWIRRAVVNLSQDLGTVGTICRELRESGYPVTGLITRTPEDPSVRLALTHSSVPHVGYVLRHIQNPPAEALDLQIEHIHPQTPADAWSGDGEVTTWGQLSNDEKAEFRTVLNTIGNLSLLEAPLNEGAGNRSFRIKAGGYYPKSLVPEMAELAATSTWDYAAITQRTRDLTAEFLRIWPRPTDVPMAASDELVRIVDLSIPPGKADPDIFEYVLFEDALWGEIHDVRQLLTKVGYTLWLRDEGKFRATQLGKFIHEARTPRLTYVTLPDGQLMYAGWAPHFLLEAIQEALTDFGLADRVRAKLIIQD